MFQSILINSDEQSLASRERNSRSHARDTACDRHLGYRRRPALRSDRVWSLHVGGGNIREYRIDSIEWCMNSVKLCKPFYKEKIIVKQLRTKRKTLKTKEETLYFRIVYSTFRSIMISFANIRILKEEKYSCKRDSLWSLSIASIVSKIDILARCTKCMLRSMSACARTLTQALIICQCYL